MVEEHPSLTWEANKLLFFMFDRAQASTILYDIQQKSCYAIKGPLILEAVCFAVTPRTHEALMRHLSTFADQFGCDPQTVVEACISKGLLIRSDRKDSDTEDAFDRWRRFGWDAAANYHFFTRDFPFLDYSRADAYSSDQGLMTQYKSDWPEAPRYKDYVDSDFFALGVDTSLLDGVSLHSLADSRLPKPQEQPLDCVRLGTLLHYTLGQTGSIRFPVVEPLLRRTSPSGGARHPTEAYLAVLVPIDGLPAGIYHYSVRRGGLERISSCETYDTILTALRTLSERDSLEPKAILFFSSLVERNMWRYREPRTYRVIHLDLGHITWTANLLACGLGLRTFSHHGMDEMYIEKLLGLDSVQESVYWYMALG